MPYHSFLDKGGEMGNLIRAYDWSATSLGAPTAWHQSLLTSLNIMLNTRFPMLVFWGNDLITFYNDAFRPSLGNDGKHPGSLGQPGHISWAESWPVIGPMIHNIMAGGDAVWFEDQKLPIYREGQMGFAYWTYSFSPILNDDKRVGGLLVTCTETTAAVLAAEELDAQYKKEQQLNEELAATNEELAVINDELTAMQKVAMESINEVEMQKEQLHLAIDSANLGTWYIDAVTREFIPSARLKELFGFHPDEDMPYNSAMNQVVDEYRNKVALAVEGAFTKGETYDLEYPIIGYHDKKVRWIRATGKLFTSADGKSNFSGTVADITERRQDEQRKNDFIGMVSHEMKTPLTSLSAYLQIAQDKASNGDSFVTNMLDKANKQVGKITTLINGFLNVSRLESGKIHIDKQRFDLALLVKEAEEEVISTINSHRIVFAPVETTFVNADRDKINQVINNLISNAVKYSPANTLINISCVTENGCASFAVKDEGIGIKAEDIPKLFDRFYRVNEGMNIAAGFGIGLYVCYEIIQRHNGKLWVESEVGKGSTFYFSLPVIE